MIIYFKLSDKLLQLYAIKQQLEITRQFILIFILLPAIVEYKWYIVVTFQRTNKLYWPETSTRIFLLMT